MEAMEETDVLAVDDAIPAAVRSLTASPEGAPKRDSVILRCVPACEAGTARSVMKARAPKNEVSLTPKVLEVEATPEDRAELRSENRMFPAPTAALRIAAVLAVWLAGVL
jgi:hypothetical protein